MIHWEDEIIRQNMYEGNFGLEREALRIHEDGSFSHTPHPFPDNDHIVRDFCENQTEINTGVHTTLDGSIGELTELDRHIKDRLQELPSKEWLWPFSNPPVIKGEEDIPIAEFQGDLRSKTIYRDYLSGKYGRHKMTFSGVHVNFSFGEKVLDRDFELSGEKDPQTHKSQIYLDLAQRLLEYGWVLVPLTAASPMLDGSFYDRNKNGETVFSGMASCRCSELGYWNDFIPILDYSSLKAYGGSIYSHVEDGWLNSPSELYYPVRLKSFGENNLDVLVEKGVSHIELRMFDLNPFEACSVKKEDVFFAQLLMIWLCSADVIPMRSADQIRAVANFKRAAHFDLSQTHYMARDGRAVPMDRAGEQILVQMEEFYRDAPEEVRETLRFEKEKFIHPEKRYAWTVRERYGEDFAGKGLQLAKKGK